MVQGVSIHFKQDPCQKVGERRRESKSWRKGQAGSQEVRAAWLPSADQKCTAGPGSDNRVEGEAASLRTTDSQGYPLCGMRLRTEGSHAPDSGENRILNTQLPAEISFLHVLHFVVERP